MSRTPSRTAKIERPSLDHDVAARLRQAILRGELKPGTRLTELGLAREWHVSQGTVRSALKTLEFEGLVESRPRRGTFVTSVTEADVMEIYTLRDSLEALAAQRAASRVTKPDQAAIEKIVEQMKQAADAGNRKKMLDLDFEFHRTIVRISGHKRLIGIYASLESQTRLFLGMAHQFHPDLQELYALHEPYARAIITGDAETAYRLAAEHSEFDGKEVADAVVAGQARA